MIIQSVQNEPMPIAAGYPADYLLSTNDYRSEAKIPECRYPETNPPIRRNLKNIVTKKHNNENEFNIFAFPKAVILAKISTYWLCLGFILR